jgi:hypothetical protein
VTLTLEVGMEVLRMTHPLIIVTICAKYFQNPLKYEKVMARTQNIPYNRLLIFDLQCYLGLGGRRPIVAHDTSSHYCEQLWQEFTKSLQR